MFTQQNLKKPSALYVFSIQTISLIWIFISSKFFHLNMESLPIFQMKLYG